VLAWGVALLPRSRHHLAGAALTAVLAAVLCFPAFASATAIAVNSTGDAQAEDASCTLREAIVAANTNTESGDASGGTPECVAGSPGPFTDLIEFQIIGAGPHVISPATSLPAVTEPATIDGGTDILPPGPPVDEIRIDGAGTVGGAGLDIDADGATVTGISVTRFTDGVDLSGTDGAAVTGSFIGTDRAGTASLGNLSRGVRLGNAGGATTDAEVRGNVLSSNGSEGVEIGAAGSTGNVIAGNRIGTTPSGTAALANNSGVEIESGADGNTVGGTAAADRNLISGNVVNGVQIRSTTTDRAAGNDVVNNRIGTTLDGETVLGNGADGVVLSGGADASDIRENLISASANVGVSLRGDGSQPAGEDGPSANVVAGNLIGTDKDGEVALGNDTGVAVGAVPGHPAIGNFIGGATGLTAGGSCSGDCNLISGNVSPGVGVSVADATGTQILGNYIGTDASGTVDLGNQQQGVTLGGGTGTVVGSPAAPNLIAANNSDGVRLNGTTSANVIQANAIGLASDGDPLGNNGRGVLADFAGASGNLIGGTGAGEGNQIASNGVDGIGIEAGATDNALLGNSIHDNGGLGIDLVGALGVDPNDVFDADTGSNEIQNYPFQLLAAADPSTSTTAVSAEIRTEPSIEDYRIEVFASPGADPSGFGEGEAFLGGFEITTAADGKANFAEAVALADPSDRITMTATRLDDDGDPLFTSEFSTATIEGCDNIATAGNDVVTGGVGDDVLCGLGGDDTFVPGGGQDLIVGGAGTDTIDFSSAAVGYDVDLDTGIATGVGNLDLHGLVNVEDVIGTGFADTLTGDDADNELDGGAGTDELDGLGGDDTLLGSDGSSDDLDGGDGDDTVKGGDGKKDDGRGGDGDDVVKGNDGKKDDLNGNDGKDKVTGNGGSGDECDGDGGNDRGGSGCETEKSL
jgi:CSLREA domain-containing protein